MIFRPYQKLLSYLPIFKVYDPILNKSQILEMKNCVKYLKYLGILIDYLKKLGFAVRQSKLESFWMFKCQ